MKRKEIPFDVSPFRDLTGYFADRPKTAASPEQAIPSEKSAPANQNEDEFFAQAMRGVSPLSKKGRDIAPGRMPPPVLSVPPQSFYELVKGTLEFSLQYSDEYLEGHVLGLDNTVIYKLKTGQYSPEAHLDLHGLNSRQAFDLLLAFIRHSWHRGLRTLLLIPGRGRNSPDGVAILRDRIQLWLTQEPLKRVILAFCTARPVDGGPGSLYVLLRKYKKKGKVYWERRPTDLDL